MENVPGKMGPAFLKVNHKTLKEKKFISILITVPGTPHNRCQKEPAVRGPCDGETIYWTFENRACRPFVYGGCGGNDNRFYNQTRCEDACKFQGETTRYQKKMNFLRCSQ